MDTDDFARAAADAVADLDELEAAGIEPESLEAALAIESDRYSDLELAEGAALVAELESLSDDEREALAALTQDQRIALREANRG